jgi:hypothetical protein
MTLHSSSADFCTMPPTFITHQLKLNSPSSGSRTAPSVSWWLSAPWHYTPYQITLGSPSLGKENSVSWWLPCHQPLLLISWHWTHPNLVAGQHLLRDEACTMVIFTSHQLTLGTPFPREQGTSFRSPGTEQIFRPVKPFPFYVLTFTIPPNDGWRL